MITVQNIKNHIIERGLKSCQECRDKGEGAPGFYDGAIDGFEDCRRYYSVEELESKINELQERLTELFREHSDEPEKIREYWYWVGYQAQFEFLRDRLLPIQGNPKILSARAVLDLREIVKELGGVNG